MNIFDKKKYKFALQHYYKNTVTTINTLTIFGTFISTFNFLKGNGILFRLINFNQNLH